MLARFKTLKRSDQQRAIGWAVLVSGLVAAVLFFVVESRGADPSLTDVTALGYQRSMQHQMGAMMGHFGMMLTDWSDALTTPLGEALIILVCAALFAAYFFRVAWVLDHEDED